MTFHAALPQALTLHTSHGNLKCEVFCDLVPKLAEVCGPATMYLINQVNVTTRLRIFSLCCFYFVHRTFWRSVLLTIMTRRNFIGQHARMFTFLYATAGRR